MSDSFSASPPESAAPATVGPSASRAFKPRLIASLWQAIDRFDWIRSATVTGSYVDSEGLDGVGDIDLVVIVEALHQSRFDSLQQALAESLDSVLAEQGMELRINATLGPLKFNDPRTAVLHLMLYSVEGHVEHVIKSPFTCFDWQRSPLWRRRSLAEVYPVLGLQPHHFVSSRRCVSDYLSDIRAGVISFRELEMTDTGHREVRRSQPMAKRDRFEFGYHIMRFLMQNLLKLVHRGNVVWSGEKLLDAYFQVFSDGQQQFRSLYEELEHRKKTRDFDADWESRAARLEFFVTEFERQFRRHFIDQATTHVLFRHGLTDHNDHAGELLFLGRTDATIKPVCDNQLKSLREAADQLQCGAGFVSPLARSKRSYDELARRISLPRPSTDDRLIEINHGECEQLTPSQARRRFPELFAGWARGEDPQFPGGESTGTVLARALAFATKRFRPDQPPALICSHNVVLRCLVGQALGAPRRDWHRMRIPYLMPIRVVATRDFGWFVDLDESVEREMFANFVQPAGTAAETAPDLPDAQFMRRAELCN